MSTLYPADYTTLTELTTLKAIPSYQTDDNELLTEFIHEASAFVDTYTGRHFVPYVATYSFSAGDVRNIYDLDTREDLLAVTTLTNGDGTVISSDGYSLRPDNVYPKQVIELEESGAASWDFSYRESRITVAGVWGYHENYAAAWGSASTLSSTMTDSVTTCVVASAASYRVLDYILVDSEQMQVTAIAGGSLTVTRAANGTTAAAHGTTGVAVAVYRQQPTIRFCTNQIVKWMYERRDRSDGAVQLAQDLGVVIVQELPQVEKLLMRFRASVRHIRAV